MKFTIDKYFLLIYIIYCILSSITGSRGYSMLLRLTHFMDFAAFNVQVLNVYDFSTDASVGATDFTPTPAKLRNMGGAFWGRFYSSLMHQLQHSSLKNLSVRVDVVSGPSTGLSADYVIPIAQSPGAADVQSDRAPSFVAMGVRFQRPSGLFRHGYKRFAMPQENEFNAETLGTNAINKLSTFCGSLVTSPIVASESFDTAYDADVSSMRYVLVRRVVSGQQLAVPRVAAPAGFVITGVTTQNTRKLGKGS